MKKKLKFTVFLAFLLILAGVFSSCKEKDKLFLMIDETPMTITDGGGEYSIAVKSNGTWSAVVENADWCTLANSTGTGDGVITVNVAENTTTTPRSVTIKITSGNLTKPIVINQNSIEDLGDYPKEISLTAYSLFAPCWENVETGMVIIINSEEELQNYRNCDAYSAPIDFSQHTLLVVKVSATGYIYNISKQLQKLSPNGYKLNFEIRSSGDNLNTWTLRGFLVEKIHKTSLIELETTVLRDEPWEFAPDSSASIVGKWQLVSVHWPALWGHPAGMVDYRPSNVVYEFKENGILTITEGTNVSNHPYSFGDMWETPGWPGLLFNERWYDFWLSTEKMEMMDPLMDPTRHYRFERIN
ncbi:MAG: BACON domain-containing protein [Bacteroidales bacterium]|jgi:hypothetical protein|nr:BACON domain-containing protein [Bacteroidales bacterium]